MAAPVMMAPASSTVVITQPQVPMVVQPRGWNTGLFGCLEDCPTCMCGLCCGCCLLGKTIDDMNENVCVSCCVPDALTVLRVKWRTQNRIEGGILNDCITVRFCGPCALCQLAREVKAAKRVGIA